VAGGGRFGILQLVGSALGSGIAGLLKLLSCIHHLRSSFCSLRLKRNPRSTRCFKVLLVEQTLEETWQLSTIESDVNIFEKGQLAYIHQLLILRIQHAVFWSLIQITGLGKAREWVEPGPEQENRPQCCASPCSEEQADNVLCGTYNTLP